MYETYPLLCWVGVVKADDHLALVHLRKVLVQHSGFRVTDVQITTGFGWELSHDFPLLCILQTKHKQRGSLVGPRFRRFSLYVW